MKFYFAGYPPVARRTMELRVSVHCSSCKAAFVPVPQLRFTCAASLLAVDVREAEAEGTLTSYWLPFTSPLNRKKNWPTENNELLFCSEEASLKGRTEPNG